MKKILLFLVVTLVTLGTTLMGQQTDPIKNDPNVRIGKLSNGMTYYIRANKKPENRVEFRLAVNAGSMQETDAQVGLAHFCEHMAFNGIEGYPGNTMISELQKLGVSFGGGINAYTSFDETVYEITMPTDDPKSIEFGLNIVKGWANGLILDDKEIDKERGIIIEEYRNGLGAQDRMRKKWFPVAFNGSRYADRLPIGTLENLQTFKYQTIKDFYKEWYRPDLQAIIVVGDINVDQMEAMIKEKFSSIPARTNPQPKIMYPIPANKQPMAVVCTDPEAGGSQVMVFNKHDYFLVKNVGDFKKRMTHQLYNMMLESRLSELQQDPKVPFIGASSGYENFIGQCDAYSSSVTAKEGQIENALMAILKENYRVLQFGFLETELKRAKEELLNNYEVAANETDKTESNIFASEYIDHFLRSNPIPGAKREFTFAKKYLQEITLDEINALAKEWINKENMVAVVLAPEKAGLVIPTENKILEIINDPTLQNVSAYVDTYKEQEVIDVTKLVPGKVASVVELKEVEAKEYTLSNGIKVILKKTNFKNDEILFTAKSKGGMSLYNEADLPSIFFASQFVDRAGIGELNYTSLEKKMKGKKVGVTPSIDFDNESLDGSSTPKDLEFFFQYLNAFFTNPRYDATVRELVVNETLEQMKSIKAMPMYRFFGEMISAMNQNDPYQASVLNMTEDFVQKANYERAFQIYKERFANPADFTFCFVGNFDEATMIKYLETYLGSLKTTTVKENFRTGIEKGFPKKAVRKNVYVGTEQQSFVGIALSKPIPYSPKNTMIVNQISEALQIELIEVIREQMSGVYSPMLQMQATKYPNSEYMTFIMFGCSPTNTDTLANAVMDILKNFQKNGPKKETLEKVKQQMIKDRQTNLEKNNFWLSYISGRIYMGEPLNAIATYEQSVNAITNDDIVKFMKKFVDLKQVLRIDMYPESMQK
jgi:zinc protease